MNKAALLAILAALAFPFCAAAQATPNSGIVISKDTAKAAPKLSARDSIAARGQSITDSIAAHAMAMKDSLELRRKFIRDSVTIRAKSMRDSANARNKFVMDSTLAHRKAVRDAAHARDKFVRDSTAAHYKAKQDSLKAARAMAVAAKKTKDSLRVAQKAAKSDSIRAAMALAAAVKRANDPAIAAQKAAHADSLKTAASRPHPPRMDSVVAKSYRIMNRPLNTDQMKYFQGEFGMKDVAKPESTGFNWIYRDKLGGVLIYETGNSDVSYSNENVPMLAGKDFVPDSLIRAKTDALLKELLKDKAERYTFSNFEITMIQKKDPEGANGKVYPPVPAFYTGRYVRKLDDRLVLGDAFQIRIGYGEGGVPQSFSFRDPVITDGPSLKAPSRAHVLDSLVRWTQSRTRPRRLFYPFSPDSLQIRELKPIKAFESYVVAQQKFRDESQPEGAYLLPSVTVLAQAVLLPSRKKLHEPTPVEPIILHFQFPCRPESGLCWPDGKQGMQSVTPPAPVRTAPATVNPGKPKSPASNMPATVPRKNPAAK